MTSETYDPAADPVHGSGWNSAARWGGWTWREPARGEHFRRCSFCGGIHPEDLAAETPGSGSCTRCGLEGWEGCFRGQKAPWMTDEALAALDTSDRLAALHPQHRYDPGGWYASWADRKYGWPHKFYADIPNRSPAALFVIGSHNGPADAQRPAAGGLQWVAWADMTPEQQAIVSRDGYDRGTHPDFIGFGTRPSHHAKFYTIHLADPGISQDAKDTIQRVSGLRFTFTEDGTVAWDRWSS